MGRTVSERTIGRTERVMWVRDPGPGLAAVIAVHSPRLGPALAGLTVMPGGDSADAVLHAMRAAEWSTLAARTAGAPVGGGAVVLLGEATTDALEALGDVLDGLRGGVWLVPDLGPDVEDARTAGARCAFLADPPPTAGAHGLVRATVSGWRQMTGGDDLAGAQVRVLGHGLLADAVVAHLADEGARVSRAPRADVGSPHADVVVACSTAGITEVEAVALRCRLAVGSPGDALDSEAVWAALSARGVHALPGSIAGASLLEAAAALVTGAPLVAAPAPR